MSNDENELKDQFSSIESLKREGVPISALNWILFRRIDEHLIFPVFFLFAAAQEGHESVAKLLLAGGADPNRADGCGRTALKVNDPTS